MKNKIFLYLFLFAVLYIIFQYANVKKTFEAQQEAIAEHNLEIKELETKNDSLMMLTGSSANENFSLESDEKARMYLEDLGYNIDEFKTLMETALISENKADADNVLVPFGGMDGFMRINSFKILNHKWVLVEFTDGKYWGIGLLNYFIEEDGSISFETNDGFLYAN